MGGQEGDRGTGKLMENVNTCVVCWAKELALKDYAMESNESCIYNAAQLMVASLAGSLAHVTCKEPLHGAITNQFLEFTSGFKHWN